MGKLDILYMTRVQRERFFNEEDYVRLKDCYILTSKKTVSYTHLGAYEAFGFLFYSPIRGGGL